VLKRNHVDRIVLKADLPEFTYRTCLETKQNLYLQGIEPDWFITFITY